MYRYSFVLTSDEEVVELDKELVRRGIRAEYFVCKREGARGYRFPKEDEVKLPSDEKGAYFGNDESGVDLYDEQFVLDMKNNIGTTDWIKV